VIPRGTIWHDLIDSIETWPDRNDWGAVDIRSRGSRRHTAITPGTTIAIHPERSIAARTVKRGFTAAGA
jgi:hypothetical protein